MKRRLVFIYLLIVSILLTSVLCVDVTYTPPPPQQTSIVNNVTYVFWATMSATYQVDVTETPTTIYVTPNPEFTLSIETVTPRGIIEVTP